jgi:FMN phosphatase YigB (HAD superfamily)
MKDLRAGGHKLVSVDVFDTVLLRGRESERRRMAWIARRIAEALRHQGFSRKPAQVWRARLDAQAIAYSAMRVTGDRGDVKLADIHRLQALALGVPERLLPATLEAELRADAATLRANRALVARLERLRRDGARVVAVSDTYYSGNDLERLLRTHRAEAAVDAVYASADFGATKKGGRLFPLVAAAEGVETSAILHVGDDRRADVEMAMAKGLSARWSPRSLPVRLVRKVDSLWLRAFPGPAAWGLR